MKAIAILAIIALATTASITPATNFNIVQLAQGTGAMYIDWYIATVYDTTHDWNQDSCYTIAFMFDGNWGLMNNYSTHLDSQYGWKEAETEIFWDVNQESVLYSDSSLNNELFFVANWSIWFQEGYEVNRAILAQNNGQGGWTIYGLQSVGFLGSYWDITPWLQANGLNPVQGENYFYLDNWCFVDAPSPVWSVYTNSGTILGSWNALAVYDPEEMVDWNSTNCTHFTFANSSNNLYQFGFNYINENGEVNFEGNWSLIPDPDNTTVYIGFYFGDQTSTYTVLEVFYYDAAGNIGVVDNSVCFAAFLSKKSTTMNKTLMKAFQTYINLYSPQACAYHNSQAYYLPNDEGCAAEEEDFDEVPGWHKFKRPAKISIQQ